MNKTTDAEIEQGMKFYGGDNNNTKKKRDGTEKYNLERESETWMQFSGVCERAWRINGPWEIGKEEDPVDWWPPSK